MMMQNSIFVAGGSDFMVHVLNSEEFRFRNASERDCSSSHLMHRTLTRNLSWSIHRMIRSGVVLLVGTSAAARIGGAVAPAVAKLVVVDIGVAHFSQAETAAVL